MTEEFDYDRAMREAQFLIDNPHFEQRPATIIEFLGKDYLDIEDLVRPGIKQGLIDIFGDEINPNRIALKREAMLTGAIGIGKTTFASIALPYMCHWVLCLRDPQKYFSLLPGSRIAFMQMSTSEGQAAEVVFGDIFARIKHSKWFVENYPFDPKFTKQIRFAKDIWVLPGDSAETTFEGYNILGGILDEVDSHKVTKDKDYAEQGFTTINSRIESRFGDQGLIIVIGQMKKAVGFAATKYEEMLKNPKAHVVRMTIWESFGWDKYLNKNGTRDSFFYDKRRKQIIPPGAGALIESGSENIIEVPNVYIESFKNAPEKALRDLAGIPPQINDPFISLEDRIYAGRDAWILRNGEESPVTDDPARPKFAKWFRADNDPRKRAIHIDLATSGDGDALGMAMGHIQSIMEIDDEEKPYIVFDMLLRIQAPPGTEILLSEVRRLIYELKEERHFKIVNVTMDGFQSTDTMQQLRKKKYRVDYLSVDKTTLPYEDLRDAIYDRRIEFPPYLTYLTRGADKRVEIAIKELSELQDTGKKIDHPAKGSKDVADAMAGVVHTLMGDRSYRRGLQSRRPQSDLTTPRGLDSVAPSRADLDGNGLWAPRPRADLLTLGEGSLGLSIPARLRPKNRR